MSSPPKSRLDALLVVATIAFAFLAASFAAANSDLWMHLAAGRLIAFGDYSFGRDPFSYITGDQYWANHAWLFDFAFYQCFQFGGPAALVGMKALGVAVAAGIMLKLARRGDGPVWLGCGCTLLAVLAMSPRLLLQPQCLSLLMLAVCLKLLVEGGRGVRWVPPLIALWVNVDAWFLLGPILVLLFRFGDAKRARAEGWPRWLLPASFFACLVSPHHVHALALPPELSPQVWSSAFRDDPRFAAFFAHPWRAAPFGATGGYSLAAWAFPVLLGASLLSFVVNRSASRDWRFAVWLPFAALAVWQARLVPFFAVVAGPVLAINLGERFGSRACLRGGRLITSLCAVALLILAWPGWLQGFHARDRGIAWQLTPDPSLAHAAKCIHPLRTSGSLAPDQRVFNTSPDAAHHLMWFAPGERSYLDSRLQLFTAAAEENREVGVSLGLIPGANSVKGPSILRARDVSIVLLSDLDRPALGSAIRTLVEQSDRFTLLDVDGSALLFRFDSKRPGFDANRLAFAPGESFPVPAATGPPALPVPAVWWNLAANRQPVRTNEGESSPVLLRLFELQRGTERSPALPLLAIRSARTSLAWYPDGDEVWLALARSYLNLGRGSWEAAAGADLTLLRYLRHAQVVGALQQAVTKNPDLGAAHELLAGAFHERGMFDLALHHRREQMRLVRRIGGDAADPERFAQLQETINLTERVVQDAENRFLVHTNALAGNPLRRAEIARELGLANTAIDTLVKSHPDLYGVEGLQLLVDLLLQTGRLSDARVLLDREELKRSPDSLDVFKLPGGMKDGKPSWRYSIPAYDWFDFCQWAAAGDYDRSESALERLREHFFRLESFALPHVRQVHLRTALAELGSPFLMDRAAVRIEREFWAANVGQTQFLSSVRGDLHTLSGLLHLERGAIREADRDFHQALERYSDASDPTAVHPGRPLAVRYRDALRIHAK